MGGWQASAAASQVQTGDQTQQGHVQQVKWQEGSSATRTGKLGGTPPKTADKAHCWGSLIPFTAQPSCSTFHVEMLKVSPQHPLLTLSQRKGGEQVQGRPGLQDVCLPALVMTQKASFSSPPWTAKVIQSPTSLHKTLLCLRDS